ncbi:MAG: hypothetical protein KGP29_05455 [Proteobacteria bacterium]|nr:hypothetical protein [Pseudomonadota bacterium]
MKILKQKNLTTSLLLTALMLFASTNQANANMFNKFRKGFYFEKYNTAEEATNALLELHPIGSDVEGLIKTLEGAGAVVTEESEKDLENYKKFYPKEYSEWRKNGNLKTYRASYDKASPFFVFINYLKWSSDIWVGKDNKITSIKVHKNRAY